MAFILQYNGVDNRRGFPFPHYRQDMRKRREESKGEGGMKPELIKNPLYKMIWEGEDGYCYKDNQGLFIIQSTAIEADGKAWVHTSFSRKSKMPTYEDMARVKRDFIGKSKKAIMVFPEKVNHVNIHQYCLHLFHCDEGIPIPEFSRGGLI